MPAPEEKDPSLEEMEAAYQTFKRHFEAYRDRAGEKEMRIDLAAFRSVNEHVPSMVPILDRLERELLGERDDC